MSITIQGIAGRILCQVVQDAVSLELYYHKGHHASIRSTRTMVDEMWLPALHSFSGTSWETTIPVGEGVSLVWLDNLLHLRPPFNAYTYGNEIILNREQVRQLIKAMKERSHE